MRDFAGWSLPLFRIFGIQVRLHLLYIVFTLGMLLRVAIESPSFWLDYLLIFVVMMFVIVLLHELGHCFAARQQGGDAEEILMWPLGGLAMVQVPHDPRSNMIVAAAGPAVNLGLATICGIVLLACSYVPPLNPFQVRQVIDPQLHNYRTGSTAVGAESIRFWKKGTTEIVQGTPVLLPGNEVVVFRDSHDRKPLAATVAETTVLDGWLVWVARAFWLNWFLLLFNLLPAFPMDGGRMLQCWLWNRSDYRTATLTACRVGTFFGFGFALMALVGSEPTLAFLAVFVIAICWQQQMSLEGGGEDSFMGHDFSQGYTSLEEETPAPPKQRRVGVLRRWLQARQARKAIQEMEDQQAEDVRMDQLLARVHSQGRDSLSDDDRRFLDRMSARYRGKGD